MVNGNIFRKYATSVWVTLLQNAKQAYDGYAKLVFSFEFGNDN
jgi:hypothetical protein